MLRRIWAVAVLAVALVACAGTFRPVDESNAAERCLADARAEVQIYGDADLAWKGYLTCRRYFDAGAP